MLKYLAEFQKHLIITGFKNVRVKNVDDLLAMIDDLKQPNVYIQLFDAELVATSQHLHFAVLNALIAFRNKENISRSLAMETLLYASAQRQIKKATEIIGVKTGSVNIALVILAEKPETVKIMLLRILEQIDAELNDTVLELSDEKVAKIKEAFGVTDTELEAVRKECDLKKALVDIVIEHMALLSTER